MTWNLGFWCDKCLEPTTEEENICEFCKEELKWER